MESGKHVNEEANHNAENVMSSGVYRRLFQKQTASSSGTALTTNQLTQRIHLLWQCCPTPPTVLFPQSYLSILMNWLELLCNPLDKHLALHCNDKSQIEFIAKALTTFASINSEQTQIPENAKRSSLNSILTDYPLYSTLLFIQSEPDATRRQWWLHFLFRLNSATSGIDYHLSLEFDNVRRQFDKIIPFPLETLVSGSHIDLAQRCKNTPLLHPFGGHFIQKPKTMRCLRPFQSDNEYVEHVVLSSEQAVTVHTPVTTDGDDMKAFFHFDEESPKKSVLTDVQSKRKYQLKRVGIENAIARSNRKLPFSNNALTTTEFSKWIRTHIPDFLHLQSINQADRGHWFLFFLRLLTGNSGDDFMLSNIGAKADNQPRIKSISYKLDIHESCEAFIRLSTELFKGKSAPTGAKHYYSTNEFFDVDLPWPLNSLLNLILRQLPANKRHNRCLYEALATTPKDQQQWLRDRIKEDKHKVPYPLTPSSIYNSFDYFSAQSLPSVVKDYLQQKGSVLMHYVNMENQSVSRLLYQSWFQFLSHCGLAQGAGWSSESRLGAIQNNTHHEHIGSAITLREELLPTLFKALLTPVPTLTSSPHNTIEFSQRIALYLHCRTAIELALRPVTTPYPNTLHCAWETGLFVVQDKRVHHQEERRLLAMTESLSTVLRAYQQFCSKIDATFNRASQPCLSMFDGMDWRPLNTQNVTHLMEQYLEPFDNGSFRHICAHQMIELAQSPDYRFEQQQLHQKMNHRKRGQDALGTFSLCSIEQSIQHQRTLHSTLVQDNTSYDTRRMWTDAARWDAIIIDAMDAYQPMR